jgi:DNA-binding transcriptional ArsR family regulator
MVEAMNISSKSIEKRIDYFLGILHVKLNYICDHVSYDELYSYLTGDTPTGDVIDFNNVIENKYYFIHEIVEICELKRRGIDISGETVVKYYPKVYEAHIEALDKELGYAFINNDLEWIKDRVITAYKQLKVEERILLRYIDKKSVDELMKKMREVLTKYDIHI